MQPADKIVTPATERIHVAAPRTRHLARIPEFKKYAPPDPVRFRPKPSFDSGDLNGSSCPIPAVRDTRRDRLKWVESGPRDTSCNPGPCRIPLTARNQSKWLRRVLGSRFWVLLYSPFEW
jgi:hypothetical protein